MNRLDPQSVRSAPAGEALEFSSSVLPRGTLSDRRRVPTAAPCPHKLLSCLEAERRLLSVVLALCRSDPLIFTRNKFYEQFMVLLAI